MGSPAYRDENPYAAATGGSGPGSLRSMSMPSPHERDAYFAGDDTVVLPALAAQTVVLPIVKQQTEPEPEPANDDGSVAKNSAVMALGSIVSRATGFLRSAAIAAA